ncbi:MAG TPA: response regulator transcription factor [bacterium]|nr:response regulator transcription factor [bacterium]
MVVDPIHLVLVADDPEARSELAARLSDRSDCVLNAETDSDGDVAAAAADADAIVWDLGEDADLALSRLADAHSLRVPIVAFAADDRDGLRALAMGAAGLLPRDADAARVVLAARAAAGGLLALDPSLVEAALPVRDAAFEVPIETLTPREREVLALMAEGLANRPIAERLGITEHTAKFHVHTILAKLGTQSRTEAVVRAARLGLIAI